MRGGCLACRRPAAVATLLLAALLGGCTQVVRYSEEVTDERFGRSRFTRVPATVVATLGFAAGVPVDIAVAPVAWAVYRGQARETRDPLSVFLFPSFVLWKVGALAGAPFDLLEWAAWRGWRAPPPITQQQRDVIERSWDARGYYSEYPVTPVYPEPDGR